MQKSTDIEMEDANDDDDNINNGGESEVNDGNALFPGETITKKMFMEKCQAWKTINLKK